MTLNYRLHYAPDNASLIIRLALEEIGVKYETVLVDRGAKEQNSLGYLALNPNGLIPVLETPQGPIFETGAILLWLADTHRMLAPPAESKDRGAYLKWLFFISNTVHSDLRMIFYPHLYVGSSQAAANVLSETVKGRLKTHLAILDRLAEEETGCLKSDQPSGVTFYIACLMRWMALYPKDGDRSWFDLNDTPSLRDMLTGLEQRAAVHTAQKAEGLGHSPFISPSYANPPQGSAT